VAFLLFNLYGGFVGGSVAVGTGVGFRGNVFEEASAGAAGLSCGRKIWFASFRSFIAGRVEPASVPQMEVVAFLRDRPRWGSRWKRI